MPHNENLNCLRGEADPNGLSAHTPGAKMDAGKPPLLKGLFRYFPYALDCLANLPNPQKNREPWMTAVGADFDIPPPHIALLSVWPHALMGVAATSAFGASKYTWDGWREVPDGYERYTEAMFRHAVHAIYISYDKDSGLPHIVHAAWNALARLELKGSADPLLLRTAETLLDKTEDFFTVDF